MKVVAFGYHTVGVRCLEALGRLGAEIALVVTHQDDPGEEIWFPSVLDLALRNRWPVQTPQDPNTPELIAHLRKIQPDALFSFYYRKILSPDILRCAPKGAFNLHGSLLPKYRGRCPVNWALIHGEKETGVTLHEMVRKPDAGAIVMQRKVAIEEKDTAYTLFDKMARTAAGAVGDFYPLLMKGEYARIPQDASRATVFGGRKPQDGLFSWGQDARSIYNLVRAVTHPYPGAFTPFAGKDLFVWWARPHGENDCPEAPGLVISLKKNVGMLVATGKGALLLKRVQWAGEEEKEAWAFAQEKGIKVGDELQ